MELAIGQVYADKYRVIRVLGHGAMGAVYEAENVRIQRRVAIKALHANLREKRDTVIRFELEAQAAGRIGSHHITEVLDTGELYDGTRYMVMEFLEGQTLHERIRSRGRLTPEEIAPLVIQLLEGLAAAHEAGIVHRDLKPANVFIAKTQAGDFVKVLDFGVSKFNILDGGEGMHMTSTGMILGTPFYMSPEQAKGSKGIDGRSDLYSVGVILYEAITGHVPFSAETFNELIFRIVLESPPPAEQFVPDLDGAFAVILRKAMAREADQRFQTANEFRATLAAWISSRGAPVIHVGQGGTMMMAGARGGTLMIDSDGAMTTPYALSPLPAPVAPMKGTMRSEGVLALDESPGPPPDALPVRRKAKFASNTVVAVVLMTAASVTMGGAAAIILMRGHGDEHPSTASSASASATPVESTPAPAPVEQPSASAVASDAPSAPSAPTPVPVAPEARSATSAPVDEAPVIPELPPKVARPVVDDKTDSHSRSVDRPVRAAAPPPRPPPAPPASPPPAGPSKRSISGDL